jgi:hypothetical protein
MPGKIGYATAIFLLVVLIAGCGPDNPAGIYKENQPPDVWLAIGPPEGSVTDYRVHLYWGGWDPDGEISYFEWTLTDNRTGVFNPADTTGSDKWQRIRSSDSLFVAAADLVADSLSFDSGYRFEFRRSHTFFIRAVDDKGACSSKPVYRSFTSSTVSPEVYISTPRRTGVSPAIMPSVITFEWIARDSDSEKQEPDSVRWILLNTLRFESDWSLARDYIRDNPNAPEWSNWHFYNSRLDSGRSWTTEPALAFGDYVFAGQAKDEAGAVTPVFDLDWNVRRVFVTDVTAGPVVDVSYLYMKDILTRSADTPPTILEIPAGLPVGFSWAADASSYGGTVRGYRYGWDILDLNDLEQWEISLTPFVGERASSPARTFFFGTHTFFLEVLDNNSLMTRVTVVVNVVPFTMERSLLIVDDWEEASAGFRTTMGMLPSDEEHDAFWEMVASDVADFGPADIFQMERGANHLPVHILAKYKAVIWNAMGASTSTTVSVLNEYIEFPRRERPDKTFLPSLVEMYMEMGGKVLLCGQNIMTTVINETRFRPVTYPVIFRYELYGNQSGNHTGTGGENSVAYNNCCLNVLDIAFIQNPNGVRHSPSACPVDRIRDRNRTTDGLRACVPIDESFPRLTLRPEVSGLNLWYHESRRGLNCDLYNPPYFGTICNDLAETSPPRDCFQPMYGLECLNTSSAIFGAPVAFWSSRHASRIPPAGVPARSAVWGFEPVFFNPSQVKQAINIILFDEWKLPRGQ